MSVAVSTAWLVPLSGPTLGAIELEPQEGIVIGRHENCDVRLASDAVSRFHARLEFHDRWLISDLKSRWGTFLNGQRLAPQASMPLQQGDLIGISPWTFAFSSEQMSSRAIAPANDLARNQTLVRAVLPNRTGPLAQDRLALLLEAATA